MPYSSKIQTILDSLQFWKQVFFFFIFSSYWKYKCLARIHLPNPGRGFIKWSCQNERVTFQMKSIKVQLTLKHPAWTCLTTSIQSSVRETIWLVCKLKSSLKDQWLPGSSMINDFRSHRERWSLIGLPDLWLLLSLEVELAADMIPCGTGKRHQSHMPHSSPDHSGLSPPRSILKLKEGCPLNNSDTIDPVTQAR